MTGSLFWTVRRKIEFLEKRMNKMNSKTKQKKNQGFSLITVILAVSFIGILSMLMLYLAVSNFFMKTTDLKGKNSFYTAERALEEIKTGLQQDIGDAMSKGEAAHGWIFRKGWIFAL